jgi:acyl-ACP thioesterase
MYHFPVDSYTCDFTGRATLSGISGYIMDAASRHAEERCFGYADITKDNVAWVLSRFAVEMYSYPAFNGAIGIETWVESVDKYFARRCFGVYDGEGAVLGYARTIWAAVNMATRRPVDIPAWRPDLSGYIAADKACPIKNVSRIPAVEGAEPCMGYSVRYSDMDINNHMNSIKYIEHIVNVFDLAQFMEKTIRRFEIVYLAEGKFGDKLKLYRQKISEDEILMDTRRGEESVCRSRIIWG